MRHLDRARLQPIAVIVVATLCYCLIEYRSPLGHPTWDGVLFYFAIPVVTLLALGSKPSQWGLGLGRWRRTLSLTLALAAGEMLLLLVALRLPSLQRYYAPLGPPEGKLWPWIGFLAIDMFTWEFFFRGFMLFGLEPALGETAIYVQMMPFAIAHLGKPEIETLSSIAGGILIGYVVRYCRSLWPAFVLHLIMGLVMYNF
jgi:membrane protease YdiL (CAAX protease family)